ncbi:hypothetical protein GUJ93_ZPchr0001g29959 [Zizania palustris]|uniref:F-box domain-containing protein n=1 Tax=Zizania palustris TaxID=103762 RepID=A0A8J5V582_ZIZPA|nr:hypothetical protein GUJ93_ZPchr0001g29959 [Zizania palustris]
MHSTPCLQTQQALLWHWHGFHATLSSPRSRSRRTAQFPISSRTASSLPSMPITMAATLASIRRFLLGCFSAGSDGDDTTVPAGSLAREYTAIPAGSLGRDYTAVPAASLARDYTAVPAASLASDYSVIPAGGPLGLARDYTPIVADSTGGGGDVTVVPADSTVGVGDVTILAESTVADVEDLCRRLPPEVLSIILSLLPPREAARTAVLSTQWVGIWASTPLVLHDSDFILAANFSSIHPVADMVSRIFDTHPGPFSSVRLTSFFLNGERDTLVHWIHTMAAKGIRKLSLHNIPWAGLIDLPSDLLQCRSLERLHVCVWEFPPTAGVLHHDSDGDGSAPPSFPFLRELVLDKSAIREEDLENMLAWSPALETVVFILSWELPQRVRLISGSLRCVMLCYSSMDELAVISAPLLERIIMCTSGSNNGNVMRIKIRSASMIKVRFNSSSPDVLVPSVKILGLSIRFGVAAEAMIVPCILRCFPNIETLHVLSLDDPGRVPGQQQQGHFEFWKEMASVGCVRSSIKKVVFHGIWWLNSEMEFIKCIAQGGLVLEKMYIFQYRFGMVSDDERDAKLNMLASLDTGLTKIIFSGDDNIWRYEMSSDFSVADPFACCY